MSLESRISIIIPVYNVEKYLLRCVESLLAQTYRNLEIILVDDGSTDESGAICDVCAEKDSRVTVIHKENAGVCSARNTALKIMTGDYFTFVDSDDWLEKKAYEKAMAAMESNKADLCFFGWKRIDEVSGTVAHTFHGKNGTGSAAEAARQALIFNGYAGHIWNKIFSAAPWKKNGNLDIPEMDPRFAVGEDCEWLIRVIQGYKKAVFLSDELYNYLVRSNSAINIRKLTDARLTEVYAREKVSEETAKKWKELEDTARAKAYSRLVDNGILAFKLRDKKAASIIRPYFKNNRKSYYRSRELGFKKKLRAILAEILIRFI